MAELTHWLWFDYETDGLWREAHEPPALIEMAVALLPFGELLDEQIIWRKSWVFKLNEVRMRMMDKFVLDMHINNGLLFESQKSGLKPEYAQERILIKMQELGIGPGRCALAGSGIAPFDVPLMREYQFPLYQHMYYTPYDLGAGRRALGAVMNIDLSGMPDSTDGHRAMSDVMAQLKQARWLRDLSIHLQ